MYNTNIPEGRELPSTAKLVKSTIIALITAMILLVTVVMPAEYGIDPTGIGKAIGLKKMGEIKVSLAEEAATEKVAAPLPAETVAAISSINTDETVVTLAPNQGVEIKVTMAKGARVDYQWHTDGGKVNFDVHGDSANLNIKYHNYDKGSAVQKSATLVADFDGSHGWFWRNRNDGDVTVTLTTTGEYASIKRVK